MMIIITGIVVVVSYLFLMVSVSSGLDKFITESHFLEFV